MPATLRFDGEVLGLRLIAAHHGDDRGGAAWLVLIDAFTDGRQTRTDTSSRSPPRPRPRSPRDSRLARM